MMPAPPMAHMWSNMGLPPLSTPSSASNPGSMAEAERFLQFLSMQKMMESVRNPGGVANGLHAPSHNSISHLSSISSVPPPLITQNKLSQNIPSIASATQSRLTSNSASNDGAMNGAPGTNSLFPRS